MSQGGGIRCDARGYELLRICIMIGPVSEQYYAAGTRIEGRGCGCPVLAELVIPDESVPGSLDRTGGFGVRQGSGTGLPSLFLPSPEIVHRTS